jgi:predicted RNase H-like HicB family nuclease
VDVSATPSSLLSIATMEPTAQQPLVLPDRVRREIAILREMMLSVHYFAEASWLAAAVDFPGLCNSAASRDGLRQAAAIAWQFGFPAVTAWLNTGLLRDHAPEPSEADKPAELRLAAGTNFA